MADNDKASIFRGNKTVVLPPTTASNNTEQVKLAPMASTATDSSTPQMTSEPASLSKSGLSPTLASLATATEPGALSPNSQQTSVASFAQKQPNTATAGPSTSIPFTNPSSTNGSGFNFSNTKTGEPPKLFSFSDSSSTNTNAPFQFNQSPTVPQANQPLPSFVFTPSKQQQENASSDFSFQFNPSSANASVKSAVPSYTFAPSKQQQQQANTSNNASSGFSFQFNQSSANAPAKSAVPSFVFTPSKQQQQQQQNVRNSQSPNSTNPNSQQSSPAHQTKGMGQNNTQAMSKNLSDRSTPHHQQPNFPNVEQEATETALIPADISLLQKKTNTKLRDQTGFVVDRSDPTSPLHSLKSFEELNLKADLLKGIYSMGFQRPSRIQEIALPHLLQNPPRNLIAQSQSGTGKTAAFSLAILSRIDPSVQVSQALILSPTFELAIQLGYVIEQMAKYLPYISIAYAVRNSTTLSTANLARGQCLSQPIVIGTPGTVEDWCFRKRIIDLTKIRVCCVDEADVMIATQGFQQICVKLVQKLHSTCQMMLFSATYSDEVMSFAREIIKDPLVLRLKREKQALNNIRQFFIRCYDPEHKYMAIQQIYSHLTLGQTMIFCRTKATARELHIRMVNDKHSVRELTAALEIEQRASIINQFRDRVFNVLISTNVTSRGIDIDEVSLVVNYDMPVTVDFKPDFETYLHRIGRCGRFGKLGYTFNLIGSEKDFEAMKAIEQYFQHAIDEITIDDISNLELDQE